MIDEVMIKIRCSLCDASSDDIMIMTGLFKGKQLFICINCLLDDDCDDCAEVEKGVYRGG